MGTFLLLLLPLCSVVLHPTTAICVPRTTAHLAVPTVDHSKSVPPPPPTPIARPPPPTKHTSPWLPTTKPLPVQVKNSPDGPAQVEDSPDGPAQVEDSPDGPAQVEDSPDGGYSPDAAVQAQDSPDADPPVGKLPTIAELLKAASLFPKLVLPPIPNLANAAVKSVCDVATDKSVCLAYAHSFLPPAPLKIDPFKVMEMQMKAAKNLTDATISLLTHTIKSHDTPPALATVLGRCLDSYSDAPDNIDSALSAIAARDTETMDSEFSALIDNYQCKFEFQKVPGLLKFPVLRYDDVLYNLAGNCLDINAKLVEKRMYK